MKGMFKKLVIFVLVGIGLCLLIMYVSGSFVPNKIAPGQVKGENTSRPEPKETCKASRETIIEWFEAVGTVRPRTETNVESRVTGRVVEVLVNAGMEVTAGQKLITLDDREFQARLDQAAQGLNSAKALQKQAEQVVTSAEAEFTRAETEYKRYENLHGTGAVSSREYDQAKTAFLRAQATLLQAEDGLRASQAGVKRAEKMLEEASIALSYTDIRAVEDGQVVEKLIEPGDMAGPGKPLLVLQTSRSLRFEALVRENLIGQVLPGTTLKVSIDALEGNFDGVVEEVVPTVDPKSRTFLVKVAIQNQPGLYPGMFGRLLVPVGRREVVVVPREAVRRVGQLELVTVKLNGSWQDRFIRTGLVLDDKIEVLSGLDGEEILALPTGK